ncbi:MAG: urate hydroxylase PuuD [Elusimicrobia bacterium]|nr:urate hydroxylase PuuD [Elusimicrobiota bacterium]
MNFDLSEWLNLFVRWFHIVAGISWIGGTYFFNRLDRHMTGAVAGESAETSGLVWMVHGGGFYKIEAQKVPKPIPDDLLWFKWESMLTWISGVLLLVIVYYTGGLMVDTDSTTSLGLSIAYGVGTLIAGFAAYTAIWRSPLGRNEAVGAAVSFGFIVGTAKLLLAVMSARAAYLHIGAMMGTTMVANVWMTILPGQRKMIEARKAGREPDYALGARGKRCSRHNTFMSMPVIFLMISNHFPTATYGSQYPWQILGALVLFGWVAAKVMRDLE